MKSIALRKYFGVVIRSQLACDAWCRLLANMLFGLTRVLGDPIMKRILLALSALAIGSAAASAADIAPKYTKAPPPPPPPPCIWCGFYIGLNGGWAGTTGGNNNAVASHFESDEVPAFT